MVTAKRLTGRIRERDFQRAVIELGELNGWSVYHVSNVHRQLRSQTSVGFPDLVAVRGEKEQPTADQKAWIARLRSAGEDACVWRPSDWTEIENTRRRKPRQGRSHKNLLAREKCVIRSSAFFADSLLTPPLCRDTPRSIRRK